ncbi:MAG: divergent polysaccharide deacetylase family protein [Nitrospiraceae bacterium]|nr:MAG: divergent polysaccharide deacetylase family protein [Nitrospiraceae bacterium]
MAKSKNKKHHYILILFFIIIALFSLYEEFGKEKKPKAPSRTTTPVEKPKASPSKPTVAIIIDDLGPNKTTATAVLDIKAPLVLSILPQQPYSSWIAGEGHRLGHDIMAHIPMEAEKAHGPGKGGLYTWMTDEEILDTLDADLRTVPHAQGISNHMGSAFTQDERAMRVLISELKKRKLFFLDSRTSSKSVGEKSAKTLGVRALSRDVFLDDKDDLVAIEAEWKRLLQIANEKGHAILLAHPRKNTLQFLRKKLKDNKEVAVVPVSELIAESK